MVAVAAAAAARRSLRALTPVSPLPTQASSPGDVRCIEPLPNTPCLNVDGRSCKSHAITETNVNPIPIFSRVHELTDPREGELADYIWVKLGGVRSLIKSYMYDETQWYLQNESGGQFSPYQAPTCRNNQASSPPEFTMAIFVVTASTNNRASHGLDRAPMIECQIQTMQSIAVLCARQHSCTYSSDSLGRRGPNCRLQALVCETSGKSGLIIDHLAQLMRRVGSSSLPLDKPAARRCEIDHSTAGCHYAAAGRRSQGAVSRTTRGHRTRSDIRWQGSTSHGSLCPF